VKKGDRQMLRFKYGRIDVGRKVEQSSYMTKHMHEMIFVYGSLGESSL
jgi:hypothetical protein